MIHNSRTTHLCDNHNLSFNGLNDLLHKILHYLRDITKADAGTIYLLKNNYLKFNIFQNDSFSSEKLLSLQDKFQNITFAIENDSPTLAVESFISNKIITVDDIYADSDFNFESSKEFDQKFDYKTKAILTAPLVNPYNESVIGVVQLINKSNNGIFTEVDTNFISLSSYLITLSIINEQNSINELQKINSQIEAKIAHRTKKLEKIQTMLIEQINIDPLTGLHNRRYIDDLSKKLFHIGKRTKKDLSVMMLDIDNFKNINDTYGHTVGDEVLKVIAKIIKKNIRESDLSARFGGDEIIFLLPYTPIKYALILANKILSEIQKTYIELNQAKKLMVTVSVGISEIKSDDDQIENAIKRADDCLYQAKKFGKNMVFSS